MFKIISFAIQMLMLKKSLTKSSSAIAYVERTADHARGYFQFAVGSIVASLFLMISIVVAIIGIGLQIEQKGSVSFSGLMISAIIFFAISIFIFLISAILLGVQKQKMAERQRMKEQEAESSSIKPLFEDILKQILANITQPRNPQPAPYDPDHLRSDFDPNQK